MSALFLEGSSFHTWNTSARCPTPQVSLNVPVDARSGPVDGNELWKVFEKQPLTTVFVESYTRPRLTSEARAEPGITEGCGLVSTAWAREASHPVIIEYAPAMAQADARRRG
jgi:hypothetical protein